ncbi:MAG: hypothetical protein OXK79_07975 [Chloroflexota bacterium]|nr:hypothetical protein [Chloroflexota bacterium]
MTEGARDNRWVAEGRSATWLDLFFALIFVINIAGLTHHLVAHPDLDTLAQVAGRTSLHRSTRTRRPPGPSLCPAVRAERPDGHRLSVHPRYAGDG